MQYAPSHAKQSMCAATCTPHNCPPFLQQYSSFLKVWYALQPFGCKEVLYFDYKHLDEDREKELNCKFAEMDDLIKKCDVITVNLPLTDKTK